MSKSSAGMSTDSSDEEVSLTQPAFRRANGLPRSFAKKNPLNQKTKTIRKAMKTTRKGKKYLQKKVQKKMNNQKEEKKKNLNLNKKNTKKKKKQISVLKNLVVIG
jgi:hypothetical protein